MQKTKKKNNSQILTDGRPLGTIYEWMSKTRRCCKYEWINSYFQLRFKCFIDKIMAYASKV